MNDRKYYLWKKAMKVNKKRSSVNSLMGNMLFYQMMKRDIPMPRFITNWNFIKSFIDIRKDGWDE
jgi:hypothetical protein